MPKNHQKSYSLWKNIAFRSHKGTCLVLPLPFGLTAKLESVSCFRIEASIWTCFKCYSMGKHFSFYFSNLRAIRFYIFSQQYWDVTTASVFLFFWHWSYKSIEKFLAALVDQRYVLYGSICIFILIRITD